LKRKKIDYAKKKEKKEEKQELESGKQEVVNKGSQMNFRCNVRYKPLL